LKRWLGRLEAHVEEAPLIELETDLHVIAALARTGSLTRDLSLFDTGADRTLRQRERSAEDAESHEMGAQRAGA
jgi:hypothetical protein